MINTIRKLLILGCVVTMTLLLACAQPRTQSTNSTTMLTGYAVSTVPLVGAQISVFDATGKKLTTTTDQKGVYHLAIDGLTPPLLINSTEQGWLNISDNSKPRGRSVAAIICDIKMAHKNIANLNPITDLVVSDVARSLSFEGPVGLIEHGTTDGVLSAVVAAKTHDRLVLIKQALLDAGVDAVKRFDPVTTPMNKSILSVYELIRHNRSYHTRSGKVSVPLLFDLGFHPLSKADPLNYQQGLEEARKLKDKNLTRVFLVGDSTVSNYESERAPRAGWGQVFERKFSPRSNVLVVNAAISGRSSRSYINEGWLRMIEDLIQPGDYLFIEFGHNDEKCGSIPPKARDVFDNANTCTYPNTGLGKVQGSKAMSFQRMLESYVQLAKSKNATPILLTPITRIVVAKDKKTGVFPIKQSTHIVLRETSSGEFVGDYSQTIRDTATANNLALIDLDALTIDFANSIKDPAWKQYWLAVDEQQYPFYAQGKTGNINQPDTTHLQEKGALKVASFVVASIKNQATLKDLAKQLK